jgi:hypothetical protein
MNDRAVRNQNDDLTPAEKEELVAFGKATTLLPFQNRKPAERSASNPQLPKNYLRDPPCFRGQMDHELRNSG